MKATYPPTRPLTAAVRKRCSNNFLAGIKVPVNEALPEIEDHGTAVFRQPKDVATRCVILYGLLTVAHGLNTAEDMIVFYEAYDLWDDVTDEEQEYLLLPEKTDEDNIQYTWRAEALNLLFWCLGIFDELPLPMDMCDFSETENLPDLSKDPTGWILQHQSLRNEEEILDELDLIYRMQWAVDDAESKGKPAPAKLDEGIVYEWHCALNWVTTPDAHWDDLS